MIKPTGTVRARPSRTAAQASSMKPGRGNWNEVWDNLDRPMKAKAANDPKDGEGSPAETQSPSSEPSAKAGPDMFEAAGVAAE
jgi:hypothetical protein